MSKALKKSVEETVTKEVATQIESEIPHGFEDMTSESFTIPFLNIVQDLSAIYKQENKDPSIKLGMIYDNVSGEVFSRVKVIPVSYQRKWVEWKPRKQGGGFAGIHDECPEGAVRGEKGLELPNGNTVNDTRQHYVLYQDSLGIYNPAVIAMKSTQISASQAWATMMNRRRTQTVNEDGSVVTRRLHMYETQYELFSVMKPKNGATFYGWVIKLVPDPVSRVALEEAKSFYNLLKKTDRVDIKNSYTQADEGGVSSDEIDY